MSYTPKVIVPQAFVESALTKKYTSPVLGLGGKGTWIDKAVFANPTGSAATVTIYLVPAGGATGDSTKTIPPVTIAAGATLAVTELAGKCMAAGDELWWVSGTASAINGAVNGREVT